MHIPKATARFMERYKHSKKKPVRISAGASMAEMTSCA